MDYKIQEISTLGNILGKKVVATLDNVFQLEKLKFTESIEFLDRYTNDKIFKNLIKQKFNQETIDGLLGKCNKNIDKALLLVPDSVNTELSKMAISDFASSLEKDSSLKVK